MDIWQLFVPAKSYFVRQDPVILAGVDFFGQQVLYNKKHLTLRAADGGDSASFSSIFPASSFLCSQTKSIPTWRQRSL
jgi:hypothetical protein